MDLEQSQKPASDTIQAAQNQLQLLQDSPEYGIGELLRSTESVIASLVTEVNRIQTHHHDDDDVLDIMAIWEELCTNRELRDQLPDTGAFAHRQYVIDTLAPFVSEWYMFARDEWDFDDSFDWEFVPRFLGNLKTIIVKDITEADVHTALDTMMNPAA